MRAWLLPSLCAVLSLAGCADLSGSGISLSKREGAREHRLLVGDRFPDSAEAAVVGALASRVERGSRAFARFVRSDDPDILFKDEERTGEDRLMTPRLRGRLRRLSTLVREEWPGLRLRVTEAWDSGREHGESSLHYEGRAADITTSDTDGEKLGRLARLSVDAGFDWVFYENAAHVHVSVARE